MLATLTKIYCLQIVEFISLASIYYRIMSDHSIF